MRNDKARPLNQQQVLDYFDECGISDTYHANKWHFEMEAIGWMRGKYKIVDWRAAASLEVLRIIEQNPETVKQKSRNIITSNPETEEAMRRYIEDQSKEDGHIRPDKA